MYKKILLKNVFLRKGLISEFNEVDNIVSLISLDHLNLYSNKDLEIQKYAGYYYHAEALRAILGCVKAGDIACLPGNKDSYFKDFVFFFYDDSFLLSQLIYEVLKEFSELRIFKEGNSVLIPLDDSYCFQGKTQDIVRRIEMGLWLARTCPDGNLLSAYSEISLLCLDTRFYEALSNPEIFEFNY